MRRVMALIGFSSFFTALLCVFMIKEVALTICILSTVTLIVILIFKKVRLSILILLFITISFTSLNCFITDSKIQNYKSIYCYEETEICGELLDYPEVTESGFQYVFRTVDENRVKFSVLSNDVIDIEPGDRITAVFEFTDRYADKTEKIYFSAYTYTTDEIKIEKVDKGFNVAKFRKTLKQGITDNTTFGRGLTKAIVFGDKSGLTDGLYRDLQRCGLLHATATSGLHLTIVTGFLFAFLSFLGVSRKKTSAISIIFIILFMIVIGFKFSLMRAGIMMIMYFAANLFDREPDGFNSIGMAFAFLIVQNPYTVTSCSFLLSASATIGMILVFNPLYAKIENIKSSRFESLKKIVVSFFASALQSVVAIIFTLPITYIYFGYFSIAGVLANAILSTFISSILMMGVVICLTLYIPVVPEVLGGALDMICLAVIKIANFISEFKYCLISIDYDYMAWLFFGIATAIAAAIILYYFTKLDKKRILRLTSLICVNLTLITILSMIIFPESDIHIKVQNSGNGILITTVIDDEMLVIDTGGKNVERKLRNEMTNKCIDKISLYIAPSTNDGAYTSAQTVTSSFVVDKVLYDTRLFDKDRYNITGETTDLRQTSSISIGKLNIDIFRQENSYVLHLTNNKVSVLIIDSNTDCSLMPRNLRDCDTVIIQDSAPDDVEEIFANGAIICTYDTLVEKRTASVFDTYSLTKQTIEITMNDYLIMKKV